MKRKIKKKVIKHLKDDVKMYKREAKEDEDLMRMLRYEMAEARQRFSDGAGLKKDKPQRRALSSRDKKLIKVGKKEDKIADVMEEFKEGTLHSGSRKGPKVKKRKQAIAIALSEARRMKKKKK